MSEIHPVRLRASVRGLDATDDRVTAAVMLYDAIVEHRRFTEDDKVSHVAGCCLDVAWVCDPADITHLAVSIYMVGTFPLDFTVRALTAERFGGPTR